MIVRVTHKGAYVELGLPSDESFAMMNEHEAFGLFLRGLKALGYAVDGYEMKSIGGRP